MAVINKFTQKAKRVLSLAQLEAERYQTQKISIEHLLLGLMIEKGTIANRVLEDLGVSVDAIRKVIEEEHKAEEEIKSYSLAEETKKLLERAIEEANLNNTATVGTEHLLLAMTADEKNTGMQVLLSLGVTPEQIRRQTKRVLKSAKDELEENKHDKENSKKKENCSAGIYKIIGADF